MNSEIGVSRCSLRSSAKEEREAFVRVTRHSKSSESNSDNKRKRFSFRKTGKPKRVKMVTQPENNDRYIDCNSVKCTDKDLYKYTLIEQNQKEKERQELAQEKEQERTDFAKRTQLFIRKKLRELADRVLSRRRDSDNDWYVVDENPTVISSENEKE